MKLFAACAAAAVAFSATLATPATAGVYIEYNGGPRYHRAPPPPPVYVYRPATRVYYAPPGPRRVCRVTTERAWGPYGPVTRRIERCRDRW